MNYETTGKCALVISIGINLRFRSLAKAVFSPQQNEIYFNK